MSRGRRAGLAAALVILLVALLGANGQWLATGWAAGLSVTAQRFYVESLSTTPGVALQDLFDGNGAMNGRIVPTIDPNGGTTFGSTTANRPSWSTTDTTWTTSSSQARHGASGAPSVVSIPWLSRSSYVQVKVTAATSSNAGVGILCTTATSCIGARLRRTGGNYVLELGTLASGSFTVATSPACTTAATCRVTVGSSMSSTTNLVLTYNSTTGVARMTFGALTAAMTVPAGSRSNTRAGLFAMANSDGTRFNEFQAGTQ